MSNQQWSKDEILKLYKLKFTENKTLQEIVLSLNKSKDSIRMKLRRTNWKLIETNPELYNFNSPKKWDQNEMIQLDSYLQAAKSYGFIATKLGRSFISVERKAQETNWEAWRSLNIAGYEDKKTNEEDKENIDKLVDSLMVLCRHDYKRLKEINKNEFLRKININEESLTIPYNDLKTKTIQKLDELGLGNPETLDLGPGTYIIVGDSHGKHSRSKTFDLLKKVNDYLKADKIIHIGHILDDDNDISYRWGDFKNLVILSKIEELKIIQSQRNKFNFTYDIIRNMVILGNNLTILNQDIVSDYVATSIRNLDSEIFDPQVIVNCHRLETVSKCSDESPQYFASPGCLCERHITKTIKQIDFEDSKTVKMAFYGGFIKYRRMEQLSKYWTQGLLIVHVDKNNNHTIIPCIIKKINNDFAISYFDKIITSSGIFSPDNKIFITGDVHSPSHYPEVLDIQEQICKDYKPNMLVNLGDMHDYRALNHHEMDKGKVILSDLLKESAQTYHILNLMRKWANDCYIIFGNHERFGKDFVEKFPQLSTYLDFSFLCDLDGLGYKMTNLKDVLRIGSAKFVHGEILMMGQPGTKLEKASRTFGHDVFIGHIHYPSIRFGAYSIGFAGNMDQGYNEPNSSSWIHGFGMCNQYQNISFPTSIAIINNQCSINKKNYHPKNQDKWNIKEYNVRLMYKTT